MGNIGEMVDQHQWRATLKPGDEFAISGGGYGGAGYDILKVTRLTPTQIIVQINANYARRFNIVTGQEIGESSWRRIQPVTQEMRDAVERVEITRWLRAQIDTKPGLSVDLLRAMRDMIRQLQAATPGDD